MVVFFFFFSENNFYARLKQEDKHVGYGRFCLLGHATGLKLIPDVVLFPFIPLLRDSVTTHVSLIFIRTEQATTAGQEGTSQKMPPRISYTKDKSLRGMIAIQ